METLQQNLIEHRNYYILIPAAIAALLAYFMFFKTDQYMNPRSPKYRLLRSIFGETGYRFLVRFVMAPLALAGSIFLVLRSLGKV